MTSAMDRLDYSGDGLAETELLATPLEHIRLWVDAAQQRNAAHGDCPEPLAMSVATVDADGLPDVRTVLMRFLDGRGPGFVSSAWSTKAAQLQATPRMAASLTWPGLFRAIRFRGDAEVIEADAMEAYWQSRPWGSRISASISQQSHPVDSRATLEERFAEAAQRWPDHGRPDDVPVPEDWIGWRLRPVEVELWAGRRNRLHDRLVYERVGEGGLDDAASWRVSRRQP